MMNNYCALILLVMALLVSCVNVSKDSGKTAKAKMSIDKIELLNNNETVEPFTINWDTIVIFELPFSTEKIKNREYDLKKFCCSPECDENYKVNALDNLFDNMTAYNSLANHYDHGHPSKKQGYFMLRLPDIDNMRVLLFSYYDNDASDYKDCAIEIQIFDFNNEIVDKKVIQDGVYYECGWSREFSITQDYILRIKDNSQCVEIGDVEEITDEIKVEHLYRITSKGIVKINDKKNK